MTLFHIPVLDDESLRLQLAGAADEPFVRHLFKTARAESFAAAQLPPTLLDAVLDQQFSAQTAGHAAQFPDARSLIIMHEAQPIGRLLLVTNERRWHIVDVALMPAHRGHGIGTNIVNALARAARGQGAHELSLAVLASNVAARRLYGRLGFVENGETAAGGTHAAMAMRLAP